MKTISIFLSILILFSSCMSTTMIQTQPPGADVYIDGIKAGKTPQQMTNDKTILECTSIRIEKEGYETINTEICRTEDIDVGPILAGFFIWFPFLWAMKYYPEHSYKLEVGNGSNDFEEPANNNSNIQINSKTKNNATPKYDKLRELKALFDDGIITKEEFEKEKKKILDNE